ncbi:hypothetical protein RND71_041231 [Anisodus tanguticus]|uniref:Glucose-6-phosphate dehydrogenase C-terminal domain-containing protein n=1 Tax=Anisodus tanguticus TaxID=243964 RepID=A0AAE1QV17_9SOLA|nr:hypothetical protein RND71_041231 [Anisodus tanguticus]
MVIKEDNFHTKDYIREKNTLRTKSPSHHFSRSGRLLPQACLSRSGEIQSPAKADDKEIQNTIMWHMLNLMMSNRPQCSMRSTSFNVEGSGSTTSLDEEVKVDTSGAEASINLPLPLFETQSSSTDGQTDDLSSLSIAVIGATGKFGIFGYSRKNLTEEDLRAMIAPTLSCHIDHQYPNGYGILGDVVHSHIFQTVALLAMEPLVTLDGEDVR